MKRNLNVWASEVNTLTAAAPRVNSGELIVNRAARFEIMWDVFCRIHAIGKGHRWTRRFERTCLAPCQNLTPDRCDALQSTATQRLADVAKHQRGLLLVQHYRPHIHTSPSIKGKLGRTHVIYTVFFMVLGKHT